MVRQPVRRNEFIIGVAYDHIDQVKQIVTNIIQSEDRILKDREITVRLNELGASSINFCGPRLEQQRRSAKRVLGCAGAY